VTLQRVSAFGGPTGPKMRSKEGFVFLHAQEIRRKVARRSYLPNG
jgi:hypothetical protein